MENFTQSEQARQLAVSYAKLRELREALEAQAKLVKEKEEETKIALITEMNAQRMSSVKFDGLGRFVVKAVVSYTISDIELFSRAMLARMVDNGKHGRPLSDGLMVQKRPAKGVIEELVEAGYLDSGALGASGLEQSERLDLTFTKQKA